MNETMIGTIPSPRWPLALLKLAGLFVLIHGCIGPDDSVSDVHPNIVYILADDMGYGDVSALNPGGKLKTQHIDRLAMNGIVFTDAHSGSSVCTPTRYGVLTGRYAWRSTLKNGVTWSWDKPLIPSSRTTVASLLKRHGYQTACVGKWHLGLDW
ncbi:MAG: sulfatase-like hydrolase/transferase, partial [Saprospiraceae bacterium]|nr:sulfatase-like hydrolase/transferase [Saprospiraceae bacterium]